MELLLHAIQAAHFGLPRKGGKRKSGSVLAPWWVEDRAAFLVGREPVTRAD